MRIALSNFTTPMIPEESHTGTRDERRAAQKTLAKAKVKGSKLRASSS